MKVYVVIGMNFGDEGKGHVVNALASQDSLVVKFNGGGQASHRVVLNDGREHIFHHFGAGSLKGARTLFGSHFLINPLIFLKELSELRNKAVLRPMLIDPRCRLTTPYDMLINEFQSQTLGKHDTVGVGINETVERSRFQDLRISMKDVVEKSEFDLKRILLKICDEYLPYRLDVLNLDRKAFLAFAAKHGGPDAWDNSFLGTAKWIAEKSAIYPEEEAITAFLKKDYRREVIFEAGQGLLLDQKRDEFAPYLTRSSTGLRNALQALKLVTVPMDLTVCLVSRAYLTRHGAGPLWDELPGIPYASVNEPSNPENEHQGRMRYAYLHEPWITQAFAENRKYLMSHLPAFVHTNEVVQAVTCLDHLDKYNPEHPARSVAKVGNGSRERRVDDLFQYLSWYSDRYSEGGVARLKTGVTV